MTGKEYRQLYYEMAFQAFKENHKHTWNWSAALFGATWMAFRKMYLFSLITICLEMFYWFLIFSTVEFIDKAFAYGIFAYLVRFVLCGFYGNALYYHVVKERIREGYHLLDKYQNTSVSLVIFMMLMQVFGAFLVMPIYAFADNFAKDKYLKHSKLKGVKINENTIKAYLAQNEQDNQIGNAAKYISAIVYILFVIWDVAVLRAYMNSKLKSMTYQSISATQKQDSRGNSYNTLEYEISDNSQHISF